MSSHEKHQYFYEKYLRNEMPDNERHAFEEKLSADESFRRSFNHYKHHRKTFLADLLVADDQEAKRRWSLNSWLYLLISLTGIALAINYYAFKDHEAQTSKAKSNVSWNIFKRIPFLARRNDPAKQNAPKTIKVPADTVYIREEPDTNALEAFTGDEEPEVTKGEGFGIASDMMELDSFIAAYEKSYFVLRFKAIKDETDSMIVDSMMQMLAAKSAGRNTQQSKPVTVYVEFWRSPVNFRGYKFNGKKLVVYGIPAPYEIYLLRDDEDFILRTARNEFVLTRDNNFHKF